MENCSVLKLLENISNRGMLILPVDISASLVYMLPIALFDPQSLPLSQNNIEPCPECGHLKQKHILCSFCYAKVRKETGLIRQQINAMEGGPLRAPAVETVVVYDGETPHEVDKDKRIVERPRKRPSWFSY